MEALYLKLENGMLHDDHAGKCFLLCVNKLIPCFRMDLKDFSEFYLDEPCLCKIKFF